MAKQLKIFMDYDRSQTKVEWTMRGHRTFLVEDGHLNEDELVERPPANHHIIATMVNNPLGYP